MCELPDRLFDWAKNLEALLVNQINGSVMLQPLSLASRFKDTLRILALGISHSGPVNLDLRKLERLEELIVWPGLFSDKTVNSPDKTLRLPRSLRKFGWSFNFLPSDRLSFVRFGPNDEQWLQSLVVLAKRTEIPLHKIHVYFEPYVTPAPSWCEWESEYYYAHSYGYPWDHLEALAVSIRRQGVAFSYSEPTMTRDHFEKFFM